MHVCREVREGGWEREERRKEHGIRVRVSGLRPRRVLSANNSSPWPGQVQAEKNFIDAAVAAGCKYLVKLGTVRGYTSKDSASEYARFHAEIEEHLEKTAGGMKWTVLCPNWFMSNHLGDIFGTLPNSIIAYPLQV